MSEIRLSFMGTAEYGGRWYFFENAWHSLCSIEQNSHQLTWERAYQEPITIGDIFAWQDRLFLFSQNDFLALSYNPEIGTFESIDAPEGLVEWSEPKIMSLHAQIGCKVYVVPVEAVCREGVIRIACFDMESGTWSPFSLMPAGQAVEEEVCVFCYPSIHGNMLYAGRIGKSAYLCADLSDGTYRVLQLPQDYIQPYSVCSDGKKVYMTQENSANICCMNADGILETLRVDAVDMQPYSRILNLEKHIITLPRRSDKIVLIEKESGTVHCLPVRHLLPKDIRNESSKSYSCHEDQAYIYIHPLAMGYMLTVDKKTFAVNVMEMNYRRGNFLEMFFQTNTICFEMKTLGTLEEFADFVIEASKKRGKSYDGVCGKKIYSSIRGRIL